MNPQKLVKLSNIIGIVSILLLIYWVFTFVSIEVFGLKIFRENLTETFYMSIMGILALMFGALMINLMFNLTRIAEKHNHDNNYISRKSSGYLKWGFIISFPLILIFLFGGDYITAKKKENFMHQSAKSIIIQNDEKVRHLLNYEFSRNWLKRADNILEFYESLDKNISNVSVIVQDTVENTLVYLNFSGYYRSIFDKDDPQKSEFIFKASTPEREYLYKIFRENSDQKRYSAHDGRYELFYPVNSGKKKIVLYFSDYQRYGKMGS